MNKRNVLLVEDDELRVSFFKKYLSKFDLCLAQTSDEAINFLKAQYFDYIFLDNDLGECCGEGLDVAKYLEGNKTNVNINTKIIVHSWNRPAAVLIKAALPNAVLIPFTTTNYSRLLLDI